MRNTIRTWVMKSHDYFIVDAHVGKSLFHNAILTSVRAREKTVILVTHALHFISYCDEIYMMENGHVKEHGRYQDLMDKDGDVARLAAEFGGVNDSDSVSDKSSTTVQDDSIDQEKQRSREKAQGAAGTGRLEGRLIVKEKRTTGSISGRGIVSQVHPPAPSRTLIQCTGNT